MFVFCSDVKGDSTRRSHEIDRTLKELVKSPIAAAAAERLDFAEGPRYVRPIPHAGPSYRWLGSPGFLGPAEA
jgi:hypothetical protein